MSLKIHLYQFKTFSQETRVVKRRKKNGDRKILKLQRYGNVLPNVVGNNLFWRGH